MNIIYGVCSWGLGHATRSLPVLRKLVAEDHTVLVISHGRSLDLLKKELGSNIEYHSIPDYPMLLSENTRQFLAKSMIYWPVFIKKIEDGLQQLGRILNKKQIDVIISDGRYDMYSKKIPSFFISHQMRIMNPLRIQSLERGSELFNKFFFKRFRKVIVPDYEDEDFSGDLSHNLKKIDEKSLHYVGVLSDFKKRRLKKNIDYLISISGPEPQRTYFEEKLIPQLKNLQGSIVLTQGKTEVEQGVEQDNVTTYTYLPREKREELMNRAHLIIARSGYTTIMDLAVLQKKALLIPTPGQIEQEYLASYHTTKKTFHAVNQNMIDLCNDALVANQKSGITRTYDVNKTIENILNILNC